MGLGNSTVWLDVSKSGLHASLIVRGDEASTHAVALPAEWGVEQLSVAIGACLDGLGAKRARLSVFWRCDGAASTVVQTPVTGKAARSAAVLAEVESGGVDLSEHFVETETLAASDDGSRVLVARIDAEREQLIRQAVSDAGAKLGAIYAGESFAARAAVAHAEGVSQDDPSATLALGDDASAIAIAVNGTIKLVRFADVGLSALASAYRSVLSGALNPPDDLDGASYRMLLEEFGVPGVRDEIWEGVRGVEVLRVMQPALQRMAVELKQSARFTLEQSEQFRARLHLVGPGASVRGLAGVLAEQLEIEAGASAEREEEGDTSAFSLVRRVGTSGRAGVEEFAGAGDSAGAPVKAFWGGVAAAAALLVGVGGLAIQSNQGEQERLDSMLREIDEIRETEHAFDSAQLGVAVSALERAVREELGSTADHGASLRLIAENARGDVEIESLRASRGEKGTSLTLRARAAGDSAQDARAAMQAYVGALDASALTDRIDLGTVRMINEPDRTYASFELGVVLAETVAAWSLKGGAG